MKLHLYFLVNQRTHAVCRVSAQRSDAEMITEFLNILVPFGLNINSAVIYHVADFDDETMEVESCRRRLVEWSSTDYEESLPDGVLRSLKKTGAIPSDHPVVDADAINSRLEHLEHLITK